METDTLAWKFKTRLLWPVILAGSIAGVRAQDPYAFTNFAGLPGGLGSADGTDNLARFNRPSSVAADSAGNIYVADTYNHIVRKISSVGAVTTLAGVAGQWGSADGTNGAARFFYPSGVAVDTMGNVYVADTYNHTIRRITAQGVVTTLAGMAGSLGSADGTNGAARFFYPSGVAVDSAGTVYVADTYNHTIRAVLPGGEVSTLAGTAGLWGSADGTNGTAQFLYPGGIAADPSGILYVADTYNHTVRRITAEGVVTTLAGSSQELGNVDGTGSAARFNYPASVTAAGGYVYVADNENHTIRRITLAGATTTLAGFGGSYGSADGTNTTARFFFPAGVAMQTTNVIVADYLNHTIRRVTASGVVTTVAGTPALLGSSDSGTGTARFNLPSGIALDSSSGAFYVADTQSHTIRRIQPSGQVTTFAGAALYAGTNNGSGSAARFFSPTCVAVDMAGYCYVADTGNHAIRKISPAGVVTNFAGFPGASGSLNGMGVGARFNTPSGVAVDTAGNVYVADSWNFMIRKVTSAGLVTTIAGAAGSYGSTDGSGGIARFSNPMGVAVDSAGNLFVTDRSNHTIRKITPAAAVSTFAGVAGNSGTNDGPGSSARFRFPAAIVIDSADNIYVADQENHTIRKITSSAVVTTLAGGPSVPGVADGTGGSSRFSFPGGVTADNLGNIYVADTYNCTLRKVSSARVVTTFAGAPRNYGTNNGTGSATRFNYPMGAAVDALDNVYVADQLNHTIRKIAYNGTVTNFAGFPGQLGSANGIGPGARFYNPSGVALDTVGNVYVADMYNHNIRKITTTGAVSTLAGGGVPGTQNGTGTGARFFQPSGVAVDKGGNVYVADSQNQTIRKISPSAVVSTLAGTAAIIGTNDGTGTSARFCGPLAVAVDAATNVYVADAYNHTIRKITPAGVVSTLAGRGGYSGTNDGAGSNARFNQPSALAIDGATNLYVADSYNQTIRKVTASGVVTTIGGKSMVIGSADGIGAAAGFACPQGIAADSAGLLYVSDTANDRISKGVPVLRPAIVTPAVLPGGAVGLGYTQTLAAVGGTLPYSWAQSSGTLPPGLSVGVDGTLSGTPVAATNVSFTMRVMDDQSLTSTKTLTLTITGPPTITTSSSLPPGTVGSYYAITFGVTGSLPPYTWSVVSGGLPADFVLTTSGSFHGTPLNATNASFTLQVSGANGLSATRMFTFIINPAITDTSPLPSGLVGISYNYTLQANGGLEPYSWALASGSLPAGLTLATNGMISGIPSTEGISGFTVSVTDSQGLSSTKYMELAISGPPVITTANPLPSGLYNDSYTCALNASGGLAPYVWSILAGDLPSGLNCDTNGLISGLPSQATNSTFTVQVTGANGLSATGMFNLAINPAILTTNPLPAATVGVSYSQAFSAAGGLSPYAWTNTAGNPPPGLTLGPDGVIGGTPTAVTNASFTVQVTDGQGLASSKLFSFAVLPVAPTLAISLSNRTQLTLTLTGTTGSVYAIEYAEEIPLDGRWQTFAAFILTNNPVDIADFGWPSNQQRLYRAVVLVATAGMALIPEGTFTMGDISADGNSSEQPVHSVTLSPFFIDQYEVTGSLWAEVAQWAVTNGYTFESVSGKPGAHPALMNWYSAVTWCNARSEREGRVPSYYTDASRTNVYRGGYQDMPSDCVKWTGGYRLPTEAEWEKAARGGASGHRFPWTDAETITHSRANYYSDNAYTYDVSLTSGYHSDYSTGGTPYTCPVGSFPANGYGLFEMAGNAYEWCWDWVGAYSADPQTNPRGASTGALRAIRGGGWPSYGRASGCRAAGRAATDPEYDKEIGLRTVLAP
jgi:formylglycine-generating enzyme required for sulfatase activity/sugar lactone lactonase YvrE